MDIFSKIERSFGFYKERWVEASILGVLPIIPLIVMVPMIILFSFAITFFIIGISFFGPALLMILGVSTNTALTYSWVFTLAAFLISTLLIFFFVTFFIGAAILVQAPVAPALAEMLVGGQGGFAGYMEVLRDDWKPLFLAELLRLLPPFLIMGTIVMLFMPLFLILPFLALLFMPFFMLVGLLVNVWSFLTVYATILVRMEGKNPVDAITDSIGLVKKKVISLAIGYILYLIGNQVAGQILFIGALISSAILLPVWIFVLTFYYMEERETGTGRKNVNAEYTVY